MMYNSFISVVSVVEHTHQASKLKSYLEALYPILNEHFSSFEILLVNNASQQNLMNEISPLDGAIKQNIYLVHLASRVNKNHAFLAGLDRSNGDYTVLFEVDHLDQVQLIVNLFEKTREQYDVVYLRTKTDKAPLKYRLFHRIFHFIIKKYSDLDIDRNALNSRIISRRALNSLLRLRENLRYMKAIYSMVGYPTTSIETNLKDPSQQEAFKERFKTSLIAITSYTTFLRTLLLWIFIFSFIFLVGVVGNALKVKFTGIDIFGNISEAESGWTFLVILIAVFFAITCLNLYIMSIYLSNIYNEIKHRPLYILESTQRV